MKKMTLLISLLTIFTINLEAQDMFNARKLTTAPAQKSFATWSPDGEYIVYQYIDRYDTTGSNGLWKISSEGKGADQIYSGIAEHPKWSPDGKYIVFDADTGNSIKMIHAGGGEVIEFLPDTIQIRNGGLPCWSPDSKQIAFVDSGRSVFIHNMRTGKTTPVFSRKGILPLPGCWTGDGKWILVALMNMRSRKSTIWKISPDGGEEVQITGHHQNFYRHLALSPDGSMLIYAALRGRYLGLYIMPADGGNSLPLAVTPDAHNEGGTWSPDGRKIAFNSTRSGFFDIWIMDVDTDRMEERLQLINK